MAPWHLPYLSLPKHRSFHFQSSLPSIRIWSSPNSFLSFTTSSLAFDCFIMRRIVNWMASGSGLTHRERQILEYDAFLNPSKYKSCRTEYRPVGSIPREFPTHEWRSTEPPTEASVRSAYLRALSAHRFSKLPDDLIRRITSFLNPAAAICLSITCRRFRKLIRTGGNSLSRCAKWYVMACLEQDYINRYPPQASYRSFLHQRHSHPSMDQYHPRSDQYQRFNGLTCALCKVKHSPETWKQVSPQFCTFAAQALFETKSVERICPQHLAKVVFPNEDVVPYSSSIPRWISTMQEMCMYCGKVEIREKCTCLVKWPHTGPGAPECDICPTRKIRVYIRAGTQEDFDIGEWRFCTAKYRPMFVREKAKGNNLLHTGID